MDIKFFRDGYAKTCDLPFGRGIRNAEGGKRLLFNFVFLRHQNVLYCMHMLLLS